MFQQMDRQGQFQLRRAVQYSTENTEINHILTTTPIPHTTSRVIPNLLCSDMIIDNPSIVWKTVIKQIPEVDSDLEENVNKWLERVDRIAETHKVSKPAILLATTGILKEPAKYDQRQSNKIVSSWANAKVHFLSGENNMQNLEVG